MLLLLDWSNYVFAQMDAVVDAFMVSNAADKARDLVQEFNDLNTLDPENAKQERHRLEAKLRKLLGSHATNFQKRIYQAIRKPEDLVLAFIESTDDSKHGTDSSCSTCSKAAHELSLLMQQQQVQLVAVADAWKMHRWKTHHLVLATAREFGQVLGVTRDEFAGEEAVAVEAAQSQQANDKSEDSAKQQHLNLSLSEVQQAAAAVHQVDSDLLYRLKGALLFIARHTLEKGLDTGKPLLIPGCIADEAIAAVVHANAALQQPHVLCIKSDDSDFWQLGSCDTSGSTLQSALQENERTPTPGNSSSKGSSSSSSSGGSSNGDATAEDTPDDGSSNGDTVGDPLSSPAQHGVGGSSSCIAAAVASSSSSSSNCSAPQWLFHCGIKFNLQFAAADMPRHHLQKCAILGKGQEELTHYGTVFGPVPDGVTVRDAAGTAVVGTHRPGDALYQAQFTAFDAAARVEEVWRLDVPDILQWLQPYQQQVPSIRARFLIKMVHHNIDPYCEWSAMPLQLQQTCREAAAEVLAAAEASVKVRSSTAGNSRQAAASSTGGLSCSITSRTVSRSGGISASALAAAARKAGVGSKPKTKKIVKRRR